MCSFGAKAEVTCQITCRYFHFSSWTFSKLHAKRKKRKKPYCYDEKVQLSVSAHSGSSPMNWFRLSVVLQRIGMILVSKNIFDYYVLMIAYGWGSVQYFSAHMGYNDEILSLLFHSPHSCRQSPFCLTLVIWSPAMCTRTRLSNISAMWNLKSWHQISRDAL